MKELRDYSPRYFPFYGKLRYIPASQYLLGEYEYDGTEECTDGTYWDIVHSGSPVGDFFYTNLQEVYLDGEGYSDD